MLWGRQPHSRPVLVFFGLVRGLVTAQRWLLLPPAGPPPPPPAAGMGGAEPGHALPGVDC
jgi:hypothetical protein